MRIDVKTEQKNFWKLFDEKLIENGYSHLIPLIFDYFVEIKNQFYNQKIKFQNQLER